MCEHKDKDDYFMSLMPHGITSIAAFLEKNGHEVILANLSEQGWRKGALATLNEKPDAAVVSIFSFNRTESLKYIRELKKENPELILIAGGQHPTFLGEEILELYPEIDFIIRGEGEETLLELFDNIGDTESHRILDGKRVYDPDHIPFPAQFTGKSIGVNPNEQYRYIITSRGCPNSCTYCSSPSFWRKKVSFRSPSNIIKEIRYSFEKHGIIYFSIRDDNFTLKKDRVLEFCDILRLSGLYIMWNCQARVDTVDREMLLAMKKCGLEHIQYGVESGSEKILQEYDKSITIEKIKETAALTRELGIYMSFYLMAGMFNETADDIKETINLIKKTLPHDVIVSPLAYYPGTAIYNKAKDDGKVADSIWFNNSASGIYLKDIKKTTSWMNEILEAAEITAEKGKYTGKDFVRHRKVCGDVCWMTDIMEGDYFFEEGKYNKAAEIYNKVVLNNHENIWGHLRLAETAYVKSPEMAIEHLLKASGIAPSYYGAWLRLAQAEYESGNFKRALVYAKNALELNPHDPEIREILDLLKSE
jgi:radical SAM superfamily enzyme YgiQ (UPF0313 family)